MLDPLLAGGFENDSSRREKAGDPVAAACEGPVEEARQESGAGEPEEDGGPSVAPRALKDLGERLFTGEDRPVRQDEVHRLKARGLHDHRKSSSGFFGPAGEKFEGVGIDGVAPNPVGGRAARRAIRIVDQDGRSRVHTHIVCLESW